MDKKNVEKLLKKFAAGAMGAAGNSKDVVTEETLAGAMAEVERKLPEDVVSDALDTVEKLGNEGMEELAKQVRKQQINDM